MKARGKETPYRFEINGYMIVYSFHSLNIFYKGLFRSNWITFLDKKTFIKRIQALKGQKIHGYHDLIRKLQKLLIDEKKEK